MTTISLGDMARSFQLRRQSADLKAEVQRLSGEMVTGRAADTGAQVRGDFAPVAGIDVALARLTGYRSATTEAALLGGAMQTALATVSATATTLQRTLLSMGDQGFAAQANTVARLAGESLRTAVSALNTSVGDRSLFAGDTPGSAAVIDAESLLDALETAVAGALTGADAKVAVDAWFDAPGGYATLAYTGGAPVLPRAVSPDGTADLGITAADPAIRDTLRGLAMAALLERPILAGLPQERAALAQAAGSSLLAGGNARVELAARIGIAEGRIEEAGVRNEAEASALGIARAGLLSVDPYETATRLEAAQTQLETLYALTARVSRLSLVDFLR